MLLGVLQALPVLRHPLKPHPNKVFCYIRYIMIIINISLNYLVLNFLSINIPRERCVPNK